MRLAPPPAARQRRAPDPGQAAAVAALNSGRNAFLTGMAGTGKSSTLLDFVAGSFRRVDATATTGIAALNLQEQFRARSGLLIPAYTVYRWAGMLTGPQPGQSDEDFFQFLLANPTRSRKAAFSRVARAECLVIDEISMLPGRALDYLDFHCRRIRGNDEPFGGIQVVVVGDYLQLPPVAKDRRYDWSFRSRAWREAGFLPLRLTRIHRQADPDFIDALNAFREGRVGARTAAVLSARVRMFVPRDVPRLVTHNAQVDRWNNYQMGGLDGPEHVFRARFDGPDNECEFLRKNSVTPDVLALKAGARVMVTANISPEECGGDGAVNGQLGRVTGFSADGPEVLLDGRPDPVRVAPHQWSFDPQQRDSATMEQIPLRPAYAMTIHKSQGLTLDAAHVDIRAANEPGQAYVALSRLRGLDGLTLKEWIAGVRVSEAAIDFYNNLP
jgi:hypothetical protein